MSGINDFLIKQRTTLTISDGTSTVALVEAMASARPVVAGRHSTLTA